MLAAATASPATVCASLAMRAAHATELSALEPRAADTALGQSASTFARDNSDAVALTGLTSEQTTYDNAWDAKKIFGCKCEVGYRGPDCSMKECPSGVDPQGGPDGTTSYLTTDNGGIQRREPRDCSGRGKCDYTAGACVCFKGFFGEDCSLQTALV